MTTPIAMYGCDGCRGTAGGAGCSTHSQMFGRPRRTPSDAETLALALPMHRYDDTHVRGHEGCLDEARTILRNLEKMP